MRDCYRSPSKSNPTLISSSYISMVTLRDGFMSLAYLCFGILAHPDWGCRMIVGTEGRVWGTGTCLHAFPIILQGCLSLLLAKVNAGEPRLPVTSFSSWLCLFSISCHNWVSPRCLFPLIVRLSGQIMKNIFNTRENKSISLTAFPSFQRTY